jgi:hypothetical protein
MFPHRSNNRRENVLELLAFVREPDAPDAAILAVSLALYQLPFFHAVKDAGQGAAYLLHLICNVTDWNALLLPEAAEHNPVAASQSIGRKILVEHARKLSRQSLEPIAD